MIFGNFLKPKKKKERKINIMAEWIKISPSDFAPASSKAFLDIQATIECGFSLKRVRDMTRIYSRMNKDQIIRDIRKKKEKEGRTKKKPNEKISKDSIIKDIRILFEYEKEEDYYEPKRGNNSRNNNCIEYESEGDKNRNLSLDEYLNKNETYLRNIIINLQNSDTWKILLTTAIKFISSKDTEEERVMHLSSNNIKFTFN